MPKRKIRVKGTPEYTAWSTMRGRCRNPRNVRFPRYGARGIKVAPEFDTFEAFIAHIGPRPVGTSLDRIDNDGDYAPGNVRWATRHQQMLNRSDNRLLTLNGRTQTLTEWCHEYGQSIGTVWARLNTGGWNLVKALETPTMSVSDAGKLGAQARWHK